MSVYVSAVLKRLVRERFGDRCFAWSDGGTEAIGLSPIGRATVAALHMNRPAMVGVRRMWVAMGEHPPQD